MNKSHEHPVDGPHTEYFAGGELSAEGRFKDGQRHGRWKYYYRSGKPKAVGKYRNEPPRDSQRLQILRG